jgi:hypothetical protein
MVQSKKRDEVAVDRDVRSKFIEEEVVRSSVNVLN